MLRRELDRLLAVIRTLHEAIPLASVTWDESLSRQPLKRPRDEQTDVAFLHAAVANPQDLILPPLPKEPMAVRDVQVLCPMNRGSLGAHAQHRAVARAEPAGRRARRAVRLDLRSRRQGDAGRQ